MIESACQLDAKIAAKGPNLQNTLLITLLAGNRGVETGSMRAASTTTQSSANRCFQVSDEQPAICGHFRGSNAGRAVSAAG